MRMLRICHLSSGFGLRTCCEELGAQSPRWRTGLCTQGPSRGETETVERAVVVHAGLTLM